MNRALGLALLSSLATFSMGAGFQIHPFASDKPVHADRDRWRYYFELPQGIDLTSDCNFKLDYETSPNLVGLQSSLTVFLNGQPIDSISLGAVSAPGRWNITLPKKYFKRGFNEVDIATRSRITEGPCRDDDDLRNWVRFKSTSELLLQLNSSSVYPLSAFPYPYVSWLSQTASSVPIVLPPKATDRTLSAALNLAASLGSRFMDKPLEVLMSMSAQANPSIYLGLAGELNTRSPKSAIEVQNSGLWISGRTGDQLDAAVRTLSNPELSAQMRGMTSTAIEYVSKQGPPATKVGTVSFRELGNSIIPLTGIGSQTTSLVLRRPLLSSLGRGGQLRLRYRHAAILLPSRSMLSVVMNDQPIGSVALSPNNANDGELICPVPVDLADRNEWVIQITAHNELASVDCAKNYEDVAWTTILGSSDFELREGSLTSTPYLEGFPYLRSKDGLLPAEATLSLGSNPSTALLTLAATTAARATQTNRGIALWKVSNGGLTGYEDVVVGLYNEEDRFRIMGNRLLVAPKKTGVPSVRQDLAILPSTLEGGVVVQAIAKPEGGVTYIVLGSSDQAILRFTEYLSSLQGTNALHGQVAVFTKEGDLFAFDPASTSDKLAGEEAELHRYKPGMTLIMSIVSGILVILAIFIGAKFVKRKRPKA